MMSSRFQVIAVNHTTGEGYVETSDGGLFFFPSPDDEPHQVTGQEIEAGLNSSFQDYRPNPFVFGSIDNVRRFLLHSKSGQPQIIYWKWNAKESLLRFVPLGNLDELIEEARREIDRGNCQQALRTIEVILYAVHAGEEQWSRSERLANEVRDSTSGETKAMANKVLHLVKLNRKLAAMIDSLRQLTGANIASKSDADLDRALEKREHASWLSEQLDNWQAMKLVNEKGELLDGERMARNISPTPMKVIGIGVNPIPVTKTKNSPTAS